MKDYKKTLIISSLICLLPLVISFAVYNKLPDQIAIHWDDAGNPDNYAAKWVAAFDAPASAGDSPDWDGYHSSRSEKKQPVSCNASAQLLAGTSAQRDRCAGYSFDWHGERTFRFRRLSP